VASRLLFVTVAPAVRYPDIASIVVFCKSPFESFHHSPRPCDPECKIERKTSLPRLEQPRIVGRNEECEVYDEW
jgi:hypothetical protein